MTVDEVLWEENNSNNNFFFIGCKTILIFWLFFNRERTDLIMSCWYNFACNCKFVLSCFSSLLLDLVDVVCDWGGGKSCCCCWFSACCGHNPEGWKHHGRIHGATSRSRSSPSGVHPRRWLPERPRGRWRSRRSRAWGTWTFSVLCVESGSKRTMNFIKNQDSS